jgi:hypothetical protein
MPIRKKINELIEQLQRAKDEEIVAIERLRAYMQSHAIDVVKLKTLTTEMVTNCERSAQLWRELHDMTPAAEPN